MKKTPLPTYKSLKISEIVPFLRNPIHSLSKIIFVTGFLMVLIFEIQAQNTPLALNGRLRLLGNQLCNENGKAIQLRGMATHGIQWFAGCYTNSSMNALATVWGADVIRVSMYLDQGGYLSNPQGTIAQVNQIASYAKANGMYCIIDWHVLDDGNPLDYLSQASTFFQQMAQQYAGEKHILYEICNEPNGSGGTWQNIKQYAQQIIPIIRQYDAQPIIIVGTPNWSSQPDQAAADPLTGDNAYNVMYTRHIYAGTHYDESYMDGILHQIPIMVTEFGTSNATGNGGNDYTNAQNWVNLFAGGNSAGIKVSWCNWSFSDKAESSAALNSGACGNNQWNNTTYSGSWIQNNFLNPADDFGNGVIVCDPTLIQAENFNQMSSVKTELTTDICGGWDVGYIITGSWMKYDKINFPVSGSYIVEYRVASANGGQLSMDLNSGSIQLGTITIPPTGGWQNWQTVTQNITVTAGTYDVGVFAQTGGWNINWLKITPALTVAAPTVTTPVTYCQNALATALSATGTSLLWYSNATGGTGSTTAPIPNTSNAGTTNYYVSQTISGTESARALIAVTITAQTTWYQDLDGDGKGDPNVTLLSCTQPTGYAAIAGDACPTDPNKIAPGNCGCGKTEQSCLDCAGAPNGTAKIDNCGICTGGTTGLTACKTTATIGSITGTSILVYPQPFENTTKVELKNGGTIESISIYSSTGSLVYNRSAITSTEIEIGETLADGLYTVIIQTQEGIYTSKIIKIK